MKRYLIVLLLILFGGKLSKAQLVQLPKKMAQVFGRELNNQLTSNVDSAEQYSFVILVEVEAINKDSALVKSVTQLEGKNVVNYLKNTDFIKNSNFANLLEGRKTLKIYIPFFYSLINRLRKDTAGSGGFDDFVFKFNALFIREKIIPGEVYTAPIYVIGSIYE